MSRQLSLFFFLLLFSFHVYGEKVRGQIITLTDTLQVTIKIPTKGFSKKPDYLSMQHHIEYWDIYGKKFTIKPPRVREVSFNLGGYPVKLVATNDANRGQYILLKVIIEGALNLYQYFYIDTNDIGMYTEQKLVMQKRGDQVQYWNKYGFRKDLKKYLHDCPSSYEIIDQKRLENRDFVEIVQHYNQNCN